MGNVSKLKPHIKAAWLTALRSGEYMQTSHRLRDAVDGYCCLGVLCDIAVKDGQGFWTGGTEDGHTFEGGDGIWDDAMPTDLIVEWAFEPGAQTGHEARAWRVPWADGAEAPDGDIHLADLNDSLGMSFEQIADVIEEHM